MKPSISPEDPGVSSELTAQVMLAQRMPRDLNKFRGTAHAMITSSPDVAADCFYKLPPRKGRDGKSVTIEGPSVRLAEIALACWGRASVGTRVVDETDTHITVQAVFRDLENLVFISTEVRRRITNREGLRYSEDMIVMTANAAQSIARRNVTFQGIPRAFIDPLYEAARKCAVGDQKSLPDRVSLMVKAFSKMGVSIPQILKNVQKERLEDITLTELEDLLGIGTAIRDGERKIDEEFPPEKKEEEKKDDANPTGSAAPGAVGDAPRNEDAPDPKKTPVQIFNLLAARVKTAKLNRADILTSVGVRADLTPTKLSDEEVLKANTAMEEALEKVENAG